MKNESWSSVANKPKLEKPNFIDNKKLIFLIGGLLLCTIITCIYMFFSKKEVEGTKVAEKDIDSLIYYDLPEIVVNLLSSEKKQNFLKINLSLAVRSNVEITYLEKRVPILKDNLIMFLRELYYSDFTGSGSNIKLKAELLKRINKVLMPIVAEEVLVRDILVE